MITMPHKSSKRFMGKLLVGTPKYISLEQVQRLPVNGRSDIYSLGVILYLTLTGCHPFQV